MTKYKYTELENNDIRSCALTDSNGEPLAKKRVLWPVVIRTGVFSSPQTGDDELTALDEFVICNLSEEEENKKSFIEKLSNKYSFDRYLLEKVIRTCNSYIKENGINIKLTKTGVGKKIALLNESLFDKDAKDVLVFQDRVTKKFFPCFDYSEVGSEREEENALIPDVNDNKYSVDISEFGKAYDTWKILKERNDDTLGIVATNQKTPDDAAVDDQPRAAGSGASSSNEKGGFHSDNDVKDNKAVKTDKTGISDNPLIVDDQLRKSENDTSFSEAVGDLNSFCEEEEEEEEEEKEEDNENSVDVENTPRKAERIYADDCKKLFLKPQELGEEHYLAFDVVFNPTNSRSPTIITPFGKQYDEWFGRFLSLYLEKHQNSLSDEIQRFTEECHEKYKDLYTFGDTWGNEIIQNCPKLANYPQFEKLRLTIAELGLKVRDQENCELHRVGFLPDLRTIYDLLLKAVIKANKSVIVYDLKQKGLNSKEKDFNNSFCQGIISDYREKIHDIKDCYYKENHLLYNNDRQKGRIGLLSDEAYRKPWDECVYSDKTIRELLKYIWGNGRGYINTRHEIAFLFLYLSFEEQIQQSFTNQIPFFKVLQSGLNRFATSLYNALNGNDIHEDNMNRVNEILPRDKCGKKMKQLFDDVCNDIEILARFI